MPSPSDPGAALTKSTFLSGRQCLKALYLNVHHPQLSTPPNKAQQALFAKGRTVENVARSLYPGGTDLSGIRNREQALAKTREALNNGAKVLHEATFAYQGVLVRCDILVREEEGWKLLEVKSGVRTREVHTYDTAVQYYVLKGNGLPLTETGILHLNKQYTRHGNLATGKAFKVTSLLREIQELQPTIRDEVAEFKKVLAASKAPDIPIGTHCDSPYSCRFKEHCWKEVPEGSVLELSGMPNERKFELYSGGHPFITDLPEDLLNKEEQRIQQWAYRNRKAHIDREALRAFLGRLAWPLFFFDIECFQPALPLFDDTHPYQQIPFQFSLHVQRSPGEEPTHHEFLAEPEGDPRPAFLEALEKLAGTEGSVLVYNIAFERRIMQQTIRAFPEHEPWARPFLDSLTDLMEVFAKRVYYHPAMKNSHSLKAVLPALTPDLDHEDLDVQSGAEASTLYEQAFLDPSTELHPETREHLLHYCGMDTYALVRILDVLWNEP